MCNSSSVNGRFLFLKRQRAWRGPSLCDFREGVSTIVSIRVLSLEQTEQWPAAACNSCPRDARFNETPVTHLGHLRRLRLSSLLDAKPTTTTAINLDSDVRKNTPIQVMLSSSDICAKTRKRWRWRKLFTPCVRAHTHTHTHTQGRALYKRPLFKTTHTSPTRSNYSTLTEALGR